MKYTLLIVSVFFFFSHFNCQNQPQTLFQLSDSNYNKADYAESLNNCISALKISEKESNYAMIAYANYRVGRLYYILKDRKSALDYFYKSRQIIYDKKIDSLKFTISYNLGVMYTEVGSIDSALLHYAVAEMELKNKSSVIDHLKLNAVLADLHMNQTHNMVLAKQYAKKAEEYANKCNSNQWKAFVKMKFAIYYMRTKEYELAKRYLIDAQILFNKSGDLEGKIYAQRVLAETLILSAAPEARKEFIRLLVLKDSAFKAETANKIANYKTKYETDKKEQENIYLLQQNELSQIKIDSRNKTIAGLLIGLVLVVIIVFWRINVSNLKKKEQELAATYAIQLEKERISRDLHDNVGGQLSYVLYSLDGINNESKEKRVEAIQTINESVRNVISNLRETIWAINDETISANDFSDKLKVYVRTMFKNTDTKVFFTENILSNIQLNSLTGLNLYRICQEIINNAFKHSKATELKINIEADTTISIEISDNGIGFDIEKSNGETFGLTNISSRANEVGIKLDLKTKPNKGVKYKLVV